MIHITMAKNASQGYFNALEAARSFENVTVLDSGLLSSSMGLLVLYAACQAEKHVAKDEIINNIMSMKRYISSAFIIDSTHMMCQSGKISRRNSKMVVGSMEMGSFSHVARRYVRKVFLNTRNIDRRILFITYAGIDAQNIQYIQDLVQQYCPFERVYLQKASSAIASNCGPGSFGLLFFKKKITTSF